METVNPEILAARAKLREKAQLGTRLGGKNSVRLKRRPVVHKSSVADDKKLQTTVKRMGLSQLPGVDEVAMIREDGKALCFTQPKVQVAINANTFIVSGIGEEKSADQFLSSVPEFNSEILKKFAREWQKMQELNAAAGNSKLASANNDSVDVDHLSDDEEVPDLIDNFEKVALVEEYA